MMPESWVDWFAWEMLLFSEWICEKGVMGF